MATFKWVIEMHLRDTMTPVGPLGTWFMVVGLQSVCRHDWGPADGVWNLGRREPGFAIDLSCGGGQTSPYDINVVEGRVF